MTGEAAYGQTWYEAQITELRQQLAAPIPMVLPCPECGVEHIDEDEWETRPRRTHLCQFCGHQWRPSSRATVGVMVLPEMPK